MAHICSCGCVENSLKTLLQLHVQIFRPAPVAEPLYVVKNILSV